MKSIGLITLVASLVFTLVACGMTATLETDLFEELDAYTNAAGEIEFSSALNTVDSAKKPLGTNIMFETFTTTSPKGMAIEGWVVFEGNNEPLFSASSEFKFRGKLSSVQGEKVLSGFLLDEAGKPLPFFAYKAGTEFDARFDGKSVGNTFSTNAEFAHKDASPILMVARSNEGVWLSIISEDLGFSDGLKKETVSLELTALIDGFLVAGEAAVTLPGLGKLSIPVLGLQTMANVSK